MRGGIDMVSNLYKEKVSAIIAKAKEKGAVKSYSEFTKSKKGKENALSKDEIIYYTSKNRWTSH